MVMFIIQCVVVITMEDSDPDADEDDTTATGMYVNYKIITAYHYCIDRTAWYFLEVALSVKCDAQFCLRNTYNF